MAQTAREMIVAVGTLVQVQCESLYVNCIVLDVKQSYGRNRLLVKPCTGEGQQWVEMSRVTRIDESKAEGRQV